MIRTLTEEHDTVEDVSRDADAEDEGIQIAKTEVLYGCERLEGDDVIGVVPRNKAVYVTIAFAVTKVHKKPNCRRHCTVTWRECHHAAVILCFILLT